MHKKTFLFLFLFFSIFSLAGTISAFSVNVGSPSAVINILNVTTAEYWGSYLWSNFDMNYIKDVAMNYSLIDQPYADNKVSGLNNATIARTGTANCPAGQVVQNITTSTGGITSQCVEVSGGAYNSSYAVTGNCPSGYVVQNTTNSGVQCVLMGSGGNTDATNWSKYPAVSNINASLFNLENLELLDIVGSYNFSTNEVAHWKMNDNSANTNVVDSIGTHTGTANENTNLMNISGRINGALNFNGSRYVSVPYSSDFDFGTTTPFAISFWIYPKAWGSGIINDWTNGNDGWNVFINSYSSGRIDILRSGTTPFLTSGNVRLTANAWNFVVIRRIGSGDTDLNIWINGVAGNSPVSGTSIDFTTSNHNNLVFGRYYANYQFANLNGYMDDIRIYKNKVMSETEIALLYNAGAGIEIDGADYSKHTYITGSPNQAGNIIYKLPSSLPSSTAPLYSDTSGNLAWGTSSGLWIRDEANGSLYPGTSSDNIYIGKNARNTGIKAPLVVKGGSNSTDYGEIARFIGDSSGNGFFSVYSPDLSKKLLFGVRSSGGDAFVQHTNGQQLDIENYGSTLGKIATGIIKLGRYDDDGSGADIQASTNGVEAISSSDIGTGGSFGLGVSSSSTGQDLIFRSAGNGFGTTNPLAKIHSIARGCNGDATTCDNYGDEGSCNNQNGCNWISDIGDNTCQDYTTPEDCNNDGGCNGWQEDMGDCSTFTTLNDCSPDGCSWTGDDCGIYGDEPSCSADNGCSWDDASESCLGTSELSGTCDGQYDLGTGYCEGDNSYDNSYCDGTAINCNSIYDSESCSAQSGCSWSNTALYGEGENIFTGKTIIGNTIDDTTGATLQISGGVSSDGLIGLTDCYDSALAGQVCSTGGIVTSITDDPSDKMFKDNSKAMSIDTAQFNQLTPSEWTWNTGSKAGTTGYGLVAQDVENLYPQFVTNGKKLEFKGQHIELVPQSEALVRVETPVTIPVNKSNPDIQYEDRTSYYIEGNQVKSRTMKIPIASTQTWLDKINPWKPQPIITYELAKGVQFNATDGTFYKYVQDWQTTEYKTIDYAGIIALNIKQIQELKDAQTKQDKQITLMKDCTASSKTYEDYQKCIEGAI